MTDVPYETEAIRHIQRYLRQLSYFDPSIPSVPIDGIYGSDTRKALTAFQIKAGLPATGTADRETTTALYRAYTDSLKKHSLPLPVSVFPRHPDDYSVGRGDENLLVGVIQFLLRDLLTLYGCDGDCLTVTGLFDEETEKAVRFFQEIHRLPSDGRVNRVTWDTLAFESSGQENAYWEQ